MTDQQIIELLFANGFTDGWVVSDGVLILWENDEDPPAPLTRPEARDDLAD